jgi:hypothetical protein
MSRNITSKIGQAAFAIAIQELTLLGYTVSVPLTDTQPFDLIISNYEGTAHQSVQVKGSTYKGEDGNNYLIKLGPMIGYNKNGKTARKSFADNKCDMIFIVTGNIFNGQYDTYLLPREIITNISSVRIGTKFEKYRLSKHEGKSDLR